MNFPSPIMVKLMLQCLETSEIPGLQAGWYTYCDLADTPGDISEHKIVQQFWMNCKPYIKVSLVDEDYESNSISLMTIEKKALCTECAFLENLQNPNILLALNPTVAASIPAKAGSRHTHGPAQSNSSRMLRDVYKKSANIIKWLRNNNQCFEFECSIYVSTVGVSDAAICHAAIEEGIHNYNSYIVYFNQLKDKMFDAVAWLTDLKLQNYEDLVIKGSTFKLTWCGKVAKSKLPVAVQVLQGLGIETLNNTHLEWLRHVQDEKQKINCTNQRLAKVTPTMVAGAAAMGIHVIMPAVHSVMDMGGFGTGGMEQSAKLRDDRMAGKGRCRQSWLTSAATMEKSDELRLCKEVMGGCDVASRRLDLYSKKRFCEASPSVNTTAPWKGSKMSAPNF
ncbi:hypothetical protein DFJ58DRAFT_837134 [Suillus subalutaceus]|uniref:uncharacterized protein n=1 Tax=Suillus subalutaceus TaxID=48586 RepID=UPI001B85D291|nr:uncharacterized protein DFJ58DRAFT_837134 [Suillus subalutaceus]KAG1871818.1 hypothetical protein DFJ58DRAFT_837134 [Suillus subalutaceus]